MGKSIYDKMEKTKLVKIENNQVSQSSPYDGNAYPAENAVNGINTFTHTTQGVGMYW